MSNIQILEPLVSGEDEIQLHWRKPLRRLMSNTRPRATHYSDGEVLVEALMEIVVTLLIAALCVLGGGVLGYFLGLRQGKEQFRHERAAEVVTEWRQSIQVVLSELAMLQSHKDREDRATFSEDVTQKVYELRMYGLNNESWLGEKLRSKAWRLTDKLKDITAPLLHDEGIHDRASSHAFDEAMKKAEYEEESIKVLLESLNKEVGRRVRTAHPWWRRRGRS